MDAGEHANVKDRLWAATDRLHARDGSNAGLALASVRASER
jgi:hypothetical protein